MSLSDLMILLFVFFVVLFSFAYKKMGTADFQRIAAVLRDEPREKTPLDEVHERLEKWSAERNLKEAVTIEKKDDAITLNIKDQVLFQSGDYRLRPESAELVAVLGEALTKVPAPYRLGIEGHTDDAPFRGESREFHDNWDLSTRRAHAVLIALKLGGDPLQRSVVMGYGEMRPIAPNHDSHGVALPSNQARNRRVTIRVF